MSKLADRLQELLSIKDAIGENKLQEYLQQKIDNSIDDDLWDKLYPDLQNPIQQKVIQTVSTDSTLDWDWKKLGGDDSNSIVVPVVPVTSTSPKQSKMYTAKQLIDALESNKQPQAKRYKLPQPKRNDVHSGECSVEIGGGAIIFVSKNGSVVKITNNKIMVQVRDTFDYITNKEIDYDNKN